MKIQDMLRTEIGVVQVSKVAELVDNIELNCWRKKYEKQRLRFVDLSIQQVRSNGSDML